jgi:hypothetical protein
MKVYAVATAILVGLAVPLVSNFSYAAVAQSPENARSVPLDGTFIDKNWVVTVSQEDGRYRYVGYDVKTSKSIELIGAAFSQQAGKHFYTWSNGDTKYQVIWQPQDRDYVRLKVISPNQKKVLNRLLSRQEDGC